MKGEGSDIMLNAIVGRLPFEAGEPHEQVYLRLLMERDGEVRGLQQRLSDSEAGRSASEAENQLLKEQLRLAKQEIADLRASLDHERARRGRGAEPLRVPLGTTAEDDDEVQAQSKSAVRRRPGRIAPETVERLKNDRKGYPVVCPKALGYWQMLVDAGLIDERLRPTSRCGVTVAARIVSRMQTEVDPSITWTFFERYWKRDHLQSNLKRESEKDRRMYSVVNTIFGLAPDAPYQTKSSFTA